MYTLSSACGGVVLYTTALLLDAISHVFKLSTFEAKLAFRASIQGKEKKPPLTRFLRHTKGMKKSAKPKPKAKTKKKKTKKVITAKTSAASRENGKKGGRPPLLMSVDLEVMTKLFAVGMTDIEVADILNVSAWSIWYWSQSDPRFSQAVALGKGKAEERVRRNLHAKATGFYYNETTHEPEMVIDIETIGRGKGKRKIGRGATGKIEMVLTKTVRKYSPPDPNAAIVWMRIHDPKGFAEKYGTHEAEGRPAISNTNINNVVNNTIKPEEVNDEIKEKIKRNLEVLERNGHLK